MPQGSRDETASLAGTESRENRATRLVDRQALLDSLDSLDQRDSLVFQDLLVKLGSQVQRESVVNRVWRD